MKDGSDIKSFPFYLDLNEKFCSIYITINETKYRMHYAIVSTYNFKILPKRETYLFIPLHRSDVRFIWKQVIYWTVSVVLWRWPVLLSNLC